MTPRQHKTECEALFIGGPLDGTAQMMAAPLRSLHVVPTTGNNGCSFKHVAYELLQIPLPKRRASSRQRDLHLYVPQDRPAEFAVVEMARWYAEKARRLRSGLGT